MAQSDKHAHQPVLSDALLSAIMSDSSGLYLDATYGRGGHSNQVLQRLDNAGHLFAFDKDPEACRHAIEHYADDSRFEIKQSSFTKMNYLIQEGFSERFSAVFFDLGVSSPQLENALRGFSFQHDGPLDMRMDPTQGVSAAEWLQSASVKEIANVLRIYGEEHYAVKIAKAIKNSRLLKTTYDLANLVASTLGKNLLSSKNPATRTFLALRLYLNHELEDLSEALDYAVELLKVGGRLAVISFHSLEDRIVKQFIVKHSQPKRISVNLSIADDYSQMNLKKIGKFVKADVSEIRNNPRARSAHLRIAEKIATVNPIVTEE